MVTNINNLKDLSFLQKPRYWFAATTCAFVLLPSDFRILYVNLLKVEKNLGKLL